MLQYHAHLFLAGLGLSDQVREGTARGDELLRVLDLRLLLLVQLHLSAGNRWMDGWVAGKRERRIFRRDGRWVNGGDR